MAPTVMLGLAGVTAIEVNDLAARAGPEEPPQPLRTVTTEMVSKVSRAGIQKRRR